MAFWGGTKRADPEQFHLITPYETNPGKWLRKDWINQYTGETFGITTTGHHGNRWTGRVITYGEVLEKYEFHSESKRADDEGNPCTRQIVGLLHRRRIRASEFKNIGKESDILQDVESGLAHSDQSVYTEYADPRRDEWNTKIRPALKIPPLDLLVKISGLSRRMLIDAQAGRSRPHRKNQEKLVAILRKLKLI
jgi:hypothetical protein